MIPRRSGRMTAGRMSHKAETRGIGAPFLEMSHHEIDRLTNLANDSANACLGCERIFDKRHVEAVRKRAGGNMGKLLLGQALPVAPVNVDKGGRADARAGDPVDSLARCLTIG